MAILIADRVKQTVTLGPGLGTLYFDSIIPVGFQSFVAGIGSGNTTYYAITDALGNWEVGTGIVTSSLPNTLTRSVIKSSNSNALVNFTSSITVFCTAPATFLANLAQSTSKYIVQGTTDITLPNAQFLGNLGTGILKSTTGTGVVTTATLNDFGTGSPSNANFLRGDGTWSNTINNTLNANQIVTNSTTDIGSSILTMHTWNADLVVHTHWMANITDNTGTQQYLQNMIVNSSVIWQIDKTGHVTVGSADGSLVTTGVVSTARLGTGYSDSTTFLRGDGTWSPVLTNTFFVELGTLRAANPAIWTTAIWTGGVSYSSHWYANVADSTSAVQYLQTMQVNSSNVWQIDKTGHITAGSADGSLLTTGVVSTPRLGSGTANANTWLRGDSTWSPIWNPVIIYTNTVLDGTIKFIIFDITGNTSVELPQASVSSGAEFVFIRGDSTAFSATITVYSGDYIVPSGLTYTLNGQYKYIRLLAMGTVWYIVGSN